jgi:hypothetical protein
MRKLIFVTIIFIVSLSIGQVSAAPLRQEERITIAVFFGETQNWIAPPFYFFWERNGGLPIFGYPLAPTSLLTSPDDGNTYATQIFERNRLEYHPDNPEPYRIMLGRLGVEVLRQQGRNWEDFPKGKPTPGCDFFPETGHTLCEPFRTFWRSYGLDLGMPGTAMAESLALFGFPISEPSMETNAEGATVLTQWFERARFEYHPDNPPQYKVLLGLLGKELYGDYRPGVASVSGTAVVGWFESEYYGLPFWEAVSTIGSNVNRASLWIRGPLYPPDHPLYSVPYANDWFSILVDIQPDSTFNSASSGVPIPEVPGGIMEVKGGRIDGTCENGEKLTFHPFGGKEFQVTGGEPLENLEFFTTLLCGEIF